uniref:Uncharacterized protein n=1 Tax=Oryza meridionalis TaxID=40149 RepID=A0A0E0DDD8_9ORYZ
MQAKMIVRVSQGHGCIDHKLKCNLIEPPQLVSGNRAGNQKAAGFQKPCGALCSLKSWGVAFMASVHSACSLLQLPSFTLALFVQGGKTWACCRVCMDTDMPLSQCLRGNLQAPVAHGLGHQPNTPKFKASGIITV